MAKLHVGAIDCSFNNCGWCFLERDTSNVTTKIKAAGIIDNSPKILPKGPTTLDDLLRSQRLYANICAGPGLIYESLRDTKVFAAELPGGSQSSRAASCLGMARGVLGAVIDTVISKEVQKHSIVLIKPTEVHKKATGSNKATKNQIMDYVLNKYKSQIKQINGPGNAKSFKIDFGDWSATFNKGEFEHIADAIVIAELGLERQTKVK